MQAFFHCVLVVILLVLPCRSATADQPALPYQGSFPQVDSKKGLQVELVDDAIALGVRHATLNVNLTSLAPPPGENSDSAVIHFRSGDHQYAISRGYLRSLDDKIQQLSGSGSLVYLILLTYASDDPARNQFALHPLYDPAAPNRLGAPNVATPAGRDWLSATIGFLAERWSRPSAEHGRVAGYIVGNEVNSHWFWNNRGRASLEQVVGEYAAAVRIVHSAVRRVAEWPRVYISLDHHWSIPYAAGDAEQCLPGRDFVDHFARTIRESPAGDFDWHLAYHPYPERLFEPRFWRDRTATLTPDTPRITFKNLEVLTSYLERDELLYEGQPRRVILSEQGFHSQPSEEGETLQAAAFCYAYAKIQRLEGIDAFILHRHVDNSNEGGLNLGLRRRTPGGSEPYPKKKIYECFRAAGTPAWPSTSAFALPIVGLDSWDELDP